MNKFIYDLKNKKTKLKLYIIIDLNVNIYSFNRQKIIIRKNKKILNQV